MQRRENLHIETEERAPWATRVSHIGGSIELFFDPADDQDLLAELLEGDNLAAWLSKEIESAVADPSVEIEEFTWTWTVRDGCFVVAAEVEEFNAHWQDDEDAAHEEMRDGAA